MSHAEMEELGRDLMSMQERVRSLLIENQRLRDGLTIMRHLDDAEERERLLREALDGLEEKA